MNLLAGNSWSHRSFWNHLEPFGAIFSHLEFSIRSHPEVSGTIWSCLEVSGLIWRHLELSASHQEPFWAAWSRLELCGIIWSHLKLSGLIWGLSRGMSPYVIIWYDSIWSDSPRFCLMSLIPFDFISFIRIDRS